jgi:hypothetical protein
MKMTLFASMFAVLLWVGAPNASFAGSLLGNSDTDTLDDIMDNCRDVSNGTQTDTDLDGCGNACDADYDNNGVVGGTDFNRLRACFGKASSFISAQGPCAPVDSDDNLIIGGTDFNTLRQGFGKRAGISLSPLRKPDLCRAF